MRIGYDDTSLIYAGYSKHFKLHAVSTGMSSVLDAEGTLNIYMIMTFYIGFTFKRPLVSPEPQAWRYTAAVCDM